MSFHITEAEWRSMFYVPSYISYYVVQETPYVHESYKSGRAAFQETMKAGYIRLFWLLARLRQYCVLYISPLHYIIVLAFNPW